VLSLSSLAALAEEYSEDLDLPVVPLRVGGRVLDTDTEPVIMGCINLSRDSTYRDSVATSLSDAVRRGRVMAAQGAAIIDVGAESSTARAARVPAREQSATLVPVIEALAADGLTVSVESYQPDVVSDALRAGARMVNLTGRAHQDKILALAAEHDAAVVLCYVGGADVREVTDVSLDADPIPGLLRHFTERMQRARDIGVTSIVVDPGMGFYYGNLTDPMTRVQHQTSVILNTFRLRRLGLPICHALPHAFDLFGEEFRTAEAFFAVLATLGGTGVLRTHEVARVRAVRDAMTALRPGTA
jgi:dihydropteroate synthase